MSNSFDASPAFSSREGIMTAQNNRSSHEGILLPRVIECAVCGEKALSFRIRRVRNQRTVDAEFYHTTATCAGSMTPDLPAAMHLLRLAVEWVAKAPALGPTVVPGNMNVRGWRSSF
jgi:hypothetical protein